MDLKMVRAKAAPLVVVAVGNDVGDSEGQGLDPG